MRKPSQQEPTVTLSNRLLSCRCCMPLKPSSLERFTCRNPLGKSFSPRFRVRAELLGNREREVLQLKQQSQLQIDRRKTRHLRTHGQLPPGSHPAERIRFGNAFRIRAEHGFAQPPGWRTANHVLLKTEPELNSVFFFPTPQQYELFTCLLLPILPSRFTRRKNPFHVAFTQTQHRRPTRRRPHPDR